MQQELIRGLHATVARIEQPRSLFSGLRRNHGLAPDNVILFRRTEPEMSKPGFGGNNYHHRFELAVALEESGTVRIGETSYQLNPGECALIFPHQFHHYTGPNLTEWLFITFDLDHPQHITSMRNRPVTVLDPECLRLLAQIVEAYQRGLAPDSLGVAYFLSLLLLRMHETCPAPARDTDDAHPEDSRELIIQKINTYVRQNLKRAPSLEDLSAQLGYSASHLRTVFRVRLGITLGLYIRETRLAEAARLLLTSNRTVSEVAQETGFTSLNAFSRAFASYYQIPPKAYAQKFAQQRAGLPRKTRKAAGRA